MRVESLVVDIDRHPPRAGERFLVDTNVWLLATYQSFQYAGGKTTDARLLQYPRALKAAFEVGASLHWCGLSWSEVAHVIEQTEFKIAQRHDSASAKLTVKGYRGHQVNRAHVADEIASAWEQVTSLGSCIGDFVIGDSSVQSASSEFPNVTLDGYDLFLVQSLRAQKLTGIITDDSDFCSVRGITVFTANPAVIDAAKTQSRLQKNRKPMAAPSDAIEKSSAGGDTGAVPGDKKE